MSPQPSEKGSSCCKLCCNWTVSWETTLPHKRGASCLLIYHTMLQLFEQITHLQLSQYKHTNINSVIIKVFQIIVSKDSDRLLDHPLTLLVWRGGSISMDALRLTDITLCL